MPYPTRSSRSFLRQFFDAEFTGRESISYNSALTHRSVGVGSRSVGGGLEVQMLATPSCLTPRSVGVGRRSVGGGLVVQIR